MLEYRMEMKLTADDVDRDGNIKASSLMHFFQEVASRDVKRYGCGTDDLIRDNLIWVLTKLKYKIFSKIKSNETYALVTCPRPKAARSITYKRDFYIYDEAGALVAASGSQWCILNFETRKIAKIKLNFGGEFREHDAFEEGIERIHSQAPVLVGNHTVTIEDIDNNQHTNNSRYVDMIGDVTDQRYFSDLVINFSKETVLGDEIFIYKEKSPEPDGNMASEYSIITGKLADETMVFQAKVKTAGYD